jgi:hypothetical protein
VREYGEGVRSVPSPYRFLAQLDHTVFVGVIVW